MQHPGSTETVRDLLVLLSESPLTREISVSGSLLQIPRWGNILLDCGEGTWGQMRRHFGASSTEGDSAYDILRRTRLIFVSHLHADHHVGLAMLLSQRRKVGISLNQQTHQRS